MITSTFKWYVFFCFCFLVLGALAILNIDKGDWVIFLNQNRTPFLDFFFKNWTHLGNGIFALVLFIAFLFIKYRYAIIIVVIAAAQAILGGVLKNLIFLDSYRPKKFLKGIYDLQFVEGVDVHNYHSFPSGHTMTAFSLFAFLSLVVNKKYLGFIWFLCALFVGFSRNYLSQHFFEDIYAGAILGVLITTLVWYFFRKKEAENWMSGSLRDKF